jgi:hypothetical protein
MTPRASAAVGATKATRRACAVSTMSTPAIVQAARPVFRGGRNRHVESGAGMPSEGVKIAWFKGVGFG